MRHAASAAKGLHRAPANRPVGECEFSLAMQGCSSRLLRSSRWTTATPPKQSVLLDWFNIPYDAPRRHPVRTFRMNAPATPDQIEPLLARSKVFEAGLVGCLPGTGPLLAMATPQHELVATCCLLSIEHARALRAAFGVEAPNAGSALLRLQGEALLRAAWLLFAAPPAEVDKLTRTLDLSGQTAASKMDGYQAMLRAVKEKAPLGLSEPLVQFDSHTRRALNSFVHAGIHPLRRASEGYPAVLATAVIRQSNALLHVAYRLLATLTGSQRRMDRLTDLHADFTDCLPPTSIHSDDQSDAS